VTTYPIATSRSTLARTRLSRAACGHTVCSRARCAPPPHLSSSNNAVHTIIRCCEARRAGSSVLTCSKRTTIGCLVASPRPFQLHASMYRCSRAWSQLQALLDVCRPPCITQTRPTTTLIRQKHHAHTERGVPKALSPASILTTREDAASSQN
jgi:hypothetical protein